jgi:hypothetical protein
MEKSKGREPNLLFLLLITDYSFHDDFPRGLKKFPQCGLSRKCFARKQRHELVDWTSEKRVLDRRERERKRDGE